MLLLLFYSRFCTACELYGSIHPIFKYDWVRPIAGIKIPLMVSLV